MPLLDALADENGTPTGMTKTKAEIHEQGFWHRAAHVWIYNSAGEILLQLRATDKDSYPGLLDISAAGHVDAGEEPIQAAIREIREEIGLEVKAEQLDFLFEDHISHYIDEIDWRDNEIDLVWLLEFNGSIDDLSLNDGEVARLEFMPIDRFEEDLRDAVTRRKYVPHEERYYDTIIWSIRERT